MMTTKKTTTSRRKTLTPVQKLAKKTPVTTASVRKAAQQVSREELVASPLLDGYNEWLIKVAIGEIEAPPAVQTLALKEINQHKFGLEEERTKRSTDSVNITISGMAPVSQAKDITPSVTISGESKEVSDE